MPLVERNRLEMDHLEEAPHYPFLHLPGLLLAPVALLGPLVVGVAQIVDDLLVLGAHLHRTPSCGSRLLFQSRSTNSCTVIPA